MTSLNPHIFRAYDIRGKVGTDLTPDVYRLIGQGFGSILREMYGKEHPSVIVGRDMREHSPGFAAALSEGLMATGCHVLDIGMTPSPVNYFAIVAQECDAGVQVTASHNPATDNGLKLQIRKGVPYSGDDIQTLLKRIQSGQFLAGKGSMKTFDALTPYLARLATIFAGTGSGKTVVIDTGNGTDGPTLTKALQQTGAKVIGLYTEPDGTFPNHIADPSKKDTLKELQEKVLAEKADIGFGIDGDGDRVGAVDEKGLIRTCDEVLLFLAEDELKRFPGTPVVYTTSMSSALETEITAWGGTPVMCPVGHSFVEHEMHRTGAKVGGEQSGHFFIADEAQGFDDAVIVCLQILATLSRGSESFSKRLAHYPKVFVAHELRPTCPDDRKGAVIKSTIEHFRKIHPTDTMDGARIDFGNGAWANIRQANTSPKLSICMEARSPEKLKDVEDLVLGHLKTYPEISW